MLSDHLALHPLQDKKKNSSKDKKDKKKKKKKKVENKSISSKGSDNESSGSGSSDSESSDDERKGNGSQPAAPAREWPPVSGSDSDGDPPGPSLPGVHSRPGRGGGVVEDAPGGPEVDPLLALGALDHLRKCLIKAIARSQKAP